MEWHSIDNVSVCMCMVCVLPFLSDLNLMRCIKIKYYLFFSLSFHFSLTPWLLSIFYTTFEYSCLFQCYLFPLFWFVFYLSVLSIVCDCVDKRNYFITLDRQFVWKAVHALTMKPKKKKNYLHLVLSLWIKQFRSRTVIRCLLLLLLCSHSHFPSDLKYTRTHTHAYE